jgi:hypothetical protein
MDLLVQLLPLTLIVLIGWAIWHFARLKRPVQGSGLRLEGFGGWLLVVAIGQWAGILVLLGQIGNALPQYEQYWANPLMKTVIVGSLITDLGLAAFAFYVAVMMTRRSRIFPALFRVQLVLIVALPVITAIWMSLVTGVPIASLDWAPEVGRAIGRAVGAVVWILYSLKSVRVLNTFVH